MPVFHYDELIDFASSSLSSAGLEKEKAKVVAELLVIADAMGHSTHGIAFLPMYTKALKGGAMQPDGSPEVLKDTGAIQLWNGKRLSGIWLVDKAVKETCQRAKQFGFSSMTIQEAHHTGCLAAFLPQITEQGLLGYISVSGPSGKGVVPFGGKEPVLTPNPFAMGIPTESDPILIDISCSITTNSMAAKLQAEKKKFAGKWAQDENGIATDDPAALIGNPLAGLLPLGGQEYGYKGFALALMGEALTQGLAGYGRADNPTGSQTNVFIQIFDPDAFAGVEAFKRQTTYLSQLCLSNEAVDPDKPVRLPGKRAVEGMKMAQLKGVSLSKELIDTMNQLAQAQKLSFPEPLRNKFNLSKNLLENPVN